MTIAERIAKYIKKNPEVNQSKTPTVGIYWFNKNGLNLYSSKTNKTEILDGYGVITCLSWGPTKDLKAKYSVDFLSTPRNIQASYINFDNETGICEFSIINMAAKRFKNGECGVWKWNDACQRYFCADKSNIIYDIYGDVVPRIVFNYRNYAPKAYFSSVISNYMHCAYNSTCAGLEEFKKFVGDMVYKSNGGAFASNTPAALYAWASKTTSHTKLTPQQKLINTLTSIKLADELNIEELNAHRNDNANYYWSCSGCVKFEKINEKWSVLRIYNYLGNNTWSESTRIYISDDKIVLTSKNEFNEWGKCTSIGHYNSYSFINYEEIINCNRLKYIKPILDTIKSDKKVQAIINVIRHPILEQLSKIGFADIVAKSLISSTPLADIKDTFGDINEKGNNLYNILGINRHQIQLLKNNEETRRARYTEIENQYSPNIDWEHRRACDRRKFEIDNTLYPRHVIAAIKELHNCKSINHFDETITSKSADVIKWICASYGYRTSAKYMFESFPQLPNRWKFIEKMYEISNHGQVNNVISTIRDIMLTNRRISWYNNGNEMNINWDDIDSLERLNTIHDNTLALMEELGRQYNLTHRYTYGEPALNANAEKKYEETISERKYLEYEDDNYAIILPNKLVDLINEGNNLSHCVGGYVQRHASGDTTILFLRKKSDINSSWVTIETNRNRIVQMHGKFNCWMGYNDETFAAVPFVMKWLDKNHISCDKRVLMCKSNHYAMGNSFRSQAELTNLISKSNV